MTSDDPVLVVSTVTGIFCLAFMQLPGFLESAPRVNVTDLFGLNYAKMSTNCRRIAANSCLLLIASAIIYFPFGPTAWLWFGGSDWLTPRSTLILRDFTDGASGRRVQCHLSDAVSSVKSPSLESFILASVTDEDHKLNGLAVYSHLTNACQPLDDVSMAKIQVHKIALVTLANDAACPLQDLAVNAQNAGYSVLIYFADDIHPSYAPTEKKILIPVYTHASSENCKRLNADEITEDPVRVGGRFLTAADQTNLEIRVPVPAQHPYELIKMDWYLKRLIFWSLVGPTITIVWLMCAKKLCCMSGGQPVNQGQAVGNETVVESEIRNMEEGEFRTEHVHLHSVAGASARNQQESDGERQPLLTAVNADYTRQPRGARGIVSGIRKICNIVAVGFRYLILIIVALPLGISTGGLSFFRFDSPNTCWDLCDFNLTMTTNTNPFWTPFQVFCFSLYSWSACKATWTVQTNFSKLIRSDWFSSNIYLLVLGVVVPYCSSSNTDIPFPADSWFSFAIYNSVCTISHVIFIIILNKHKFVTRYVFYISVCVICAYLESDIVALFYFALNSQGFLNNLKLTALRTVAIGLTLTVSFGTSMHIIRKLTKPRESLFEGLGEN